MKRGGPLKRRTRMKRGKPLKRSRLPRRQRPTPEAATSSEIRARKEFSLAAKIQLVCAVCGRADPWDPHHVVEKQWLKANHKPQYLRPNALRLCNRFSKNDCHGKHTRGTRKVRLKELRDENIDYAFALMGPAAYHYLRRHYTGCDDRVERALEELT